MEELFMLSELCNDTCTQNTQGLGTFVYAASLSDDAQPREGNCCVSGRVVDEELAENGSL